MSNWKRRLAFKLHSWFKPLFARLDEYVKEEIRKVLQAEQYVIAEEKYQRFQEVKKAYPEFYEKLKTRPAEEDCDHLKGGKNKGPWKDYAVSYHTYADASQKIRCTICAKEWTPQSPDWKEAWAMAHQSSNTASSSEIWLKSASWKD